MCFFFFQLTRSFYYSSIRKEKSTALSDDIDTVRELSFTLLESTELHMGFGTPTDRIRRFFNFRGGGVWRLCGSCMKDSLFRCSEDEFWRSLSSMLEQWHFEVIGSAMRRVGAEVGRWRNDKRF